MNKIQVSEMDICHLALIRESVSQFLEDCSKSFEFQDAVLLDIAPQIYEGARKSFKQSVIKTLDIDTTSGADYIADICQNNSQLLEDETFDFIVCTEVLEHTLQPFNAAEEMYRILKTGGYAFITTPFNFRIHGPLPDYWRFTEHALRALFSKYKNVEISEIMTDSRDLMPIHYRLVAQK